MFGLGKRDVRTVRAAARGGRFVVAYPDGVRRAWNVGAGCCGKAGLDDLAFIIWAFFNAHAR